MNDFFLLSNFFYHPEGSCDDTLACALSYGAFTYADTYEDLPLTPSSSSTSSSSFHPDNRSTSNDNEIEVDELRLSDYNPSIGPPSLPSTFFIDPPRYYSQNKLTGRLYKQRDYLRHWKQRDFILQQDILLYSPVDVNSSYSLFASNSGSSSPHSSYLKALRILPGSEISPLHEVIINNKKCYGFYITHPKMLWGYHLALEDKVQADIWICALLEASFSHNTYIPSNYLYFSHIDTSSTLNYTVRCEEVVENIPKDIFIKLEKYMILFLNTMNIPITNKTILWENITPKVIQNIEKKVNISPSNSTTSFSTTAASSTYQSFFSSHPNLINKIKVFHRPLNFISRVNDNHERLCGFSLREEAILPCSPISVLAKLLNNITPMASSSLNIPQSSIKRTVSHVISSHYFHETWDFYVPGYKDLKTINLEVHWRILKNGKLVIVMHCPEEEKEDFEKEVGTTNNEDEEDPLKSIDMLTFLLSSVGLTSSFETHLAFKPKEKVKKVKKEGKALSHCHVLLSGFILTPTNEGFTHIEHLLEIVIPNFTSDFDVSSMSQISYLLSLPNEQSSAKNVEEAIPRYKQALTLFNNHIKTTYNPELNTVNSPANNKKFLNIREKKLLTTKTLKLLQKKRNIQLKLLLKSLLKKILILLILLGINLFFLYNPLYFYYFLIIVNVCSKFIFALFNYTFIAISIIYYDILQSYNFI